MSDETSKRATCGTCRFYGEEGLGGGDPYGACRMRAPAPSLDASTAHWPAVALSDWCGEHEPRTATALESAVAELEAEPYAEHPVPTFLADLRAILGAPDANFGQLVELVRQAKADADKLRDAIVELAASAAEESDDA